MVSVENQIIIAFNAFKRVELSHLKFLEMLFNVATATGDINRLMKLSDLSGRKCGIDSGVLDKPYLTVFSSYDCDPVTRFGDCNLKTVCVKECPSTSFYYNKTECNQSTSKVIRDQLICKAHVNVLNVKSCDDITELVERGECSSWYFDTTHGR